MTSRSATPAVTSSPKSTGTATSTPMFATTTRSPRRSAPRRGTPPSSPTAASARSPRCCAGRSGTSCRSAVAPPIAATSTRGATHHPGYPHRWPRTRPPRPKPTTASPTASPPLSGNCSSISPRRPTSATRGSTDRGSSRLASGRWCAASSTTGRTSCCPTAAPCSTPSASPKILRTPCCSPSTNPGRPRARSSTPQMTSA